MAEERGVAPEMVALELLADGGIDSPCDAAEIECFIRSAQTTLVSHMVSRRCNQPWGIATGSDDLTLAQLTLGANILLWHLCEMACDELGMPKVVLILLPHLQRLLQLGADNRSELLEAFTSRLWMEYLQRDQTALTKES
ncbi:MAG: hypothetical protein L0G49_10500 [Luteococcus sp.]|nr:hypothetical protein [Luteococcus sp.]